MFIKHMQPIDECIEQSNIFPSHSAPGLFLKIHVTIFIYEYGYRFIHGTFAKFTKANCESLTIKKKKEQR